MIYLEPRNRKGRVSKLLVVAGVLLIVVVATNVFAPNFFPSLFASIARPFWRLDFSADSGAFRSIERLMTENEELMRTVDELNLRLETIAEIEKENQSLREILGRSTSTPSTLAAVLVRPPIAPYDELVIDIGESHGLKEGSLVYAPGGVLIGKVSDILDQTSKVRLFSSPGSKFEVLIGEHNVPASATGKGGGQFEAKVPHESMISEGDYVHGTSLGQAPFGVVTAKIFDPVQPFGVVLFSQPVNVYELRWVLVDNST